MGELTFVITHLFAAERWPAGWQSDLEIFSKQKFRYLEASGSGIIGRFPAS